MTATATATATQVDHSAIAAKFAAWGAAAGNTARARQVQGDDYTAALALHRAAVYEQAARLVIEDSREVAKLLPDSDWTWLSRQTSLDVAALFMRLAFHCSVGVIASQPWTTDYDRCAVRYSCARAWQLCSWELDPDLPEVQPRWD